MTRTNLRHIVPAHRTPDVDENKCWFCDHDNILTNTICDACLHNTTPTNNGTVPVTYRMYSFGSRAKKISCCEKQHAILLGQALQLLDGGTFIAVRVGVHPKYAILIKDGNGAPRLSTGGLALPPNLSQRGQFLYASNIILATDPDPDTGKILNMHSNFMVLKFS
jgi:hypothetical protein